MSIIFAVGFVLLFGFACYRYGRTSAVAQICDEMVRELKKWPPEGMWQRDFTQIVARTLDIVRRAA